MTPAALSFLVTACLMGVLWLVRSGARGGAVEPLPAHFVVTHRLGLGAALAFGALAGLIRQLPAFSYFEALLGHRLHIHEPASLIGAVERFANSGALVFGAVACVGAAWLLLGRRWDDLALWTLSLGGGVVLLTLLKELFARPRPPEYDSLGLQTFWEYPSGHAFGAAVCAGLVVFIAGRPTARWRSAPALVAVGLALLMGLLKLVAGNHYLGDVLAGYASGTAWLCICLTLAMAISGRERASLGATARR